MKACVLLASAMLVSAAVAAGAAPPSAFKATIEPLTAAAKEKMVGVSWTAGCPVSPDDLVAIHMTHLGFDGAVHDGVLVIHKRLAAEVVDIFGELFEAGFPIELIRPYEDFAVGKYADSNATVGFYCRPAQDDPNAFSWHAYGVSIDINPKTNPFHDPKGWWPAGSDGNRNRAAPGLLAERSEGVRILMGHGWGWGGWDNPPDYMHFSKLMIGNGDNPLQRPVWAGRLEYPAE